MKKLALVVALLCAAFPAYAGSLTITVVVGSPSVTYTYTQSVSDAGLVNQFGPWLLAAYPCVPVAPAITCTPQTQNGAYQAWGAAMYSGTVANVNSWEAQAAAAPAAASASKLQ
jgi:hypothetical protein